MKHSSHPSPKGSQKGVTLLELLIVIAIIAVLAVAIILVLNPAETLRKSRDSQRISDLATLKTALGIYTTSKTSPQLDGISGTAQDKCEGGTAANEELWVSVPITAVTGGETITDAAPPIGWTQLATSWEQATLASAQAGVDGTGWIPVNLGSITGGAPISSFPLDPTNDLSITTGSETSTAAAVTNGAQMYRYACKKTNIVWEANARLESTAFGPGGDDDRSVKDGGNNTLLYEVGTDLSILPSTNDF